MEIEEMKIEPGDIVSFWENGKIKYTWITILQVDGENAICSMIVKPENLDERPTSLDKMNVVFSLKDLRLVKKM